MSTAFALLAVTAISVALSGCCTLAPCHPATALVGTVTTSNGAPVEASRITLYGTNVPIINAKGCFKVRLSDALPFTFVVTAEGFKSVEVKAKPGFYRAKVSLVSVQSSEGSQTEWLAIPASEYETSFCP